MALNIAINTLKNFTTQYNKLQDEFGTYIARLNGFSDEQLSYTDFIDNFIDKDTVADASVDGNSNVSHKDINTLEREMPKPHSKVIAFNKIYYEIEKKFGFKDANEWLREEWMGQLYLHDGNSSSYRSYCFAYDLKDLAEKGLYFIPMMNSKPANHLITFVDFIKEFISYASNRTSGAVGLPNLIPYMFYFWKKDVDNDYMGIKTSHTEEYYAKQNFQRFIYAVNQPYCRDSSQSAFTNTSIFDRPYFEALFGGSTFPDGSFMIDFEEDIMEFQKWYMEVMSDIRSTNMFTFPVSTMSFLRKDKKFEDPEFTEWAVKHNMKWSDSNLFISDSVTSLSNCCFDGSQEVIIKEEIDSSTEISKLVDVYNKYHDKTIYTLNKKGNKYVPCKVVRFEKKPVYRIELENGNVILPTYDHIHLVDDGESIKDTLALRAGDKLFIKANPMDNESDTFENSVIVSITRIQNSDDHTYCLEMEDENEPYFILPNGVVTHNCRLKSNIDDLGYFNSIGGTALKVGSIKVSTINLARLALDTNSEEEYLKELERREIINLKALDRVRHIIKRNVEKGLLPNFTYGLIDFEHCYSTIGFIGVYETMKKFGYIRVDEMGNTFYTEDAERFGKNIFTTMRRVADEFIKKYNCDYMINTEQIPGESAADKLMKKDKFFYPEANIFDLPLYGNQFLPLGIQATLQERVRAHAMFDKYCNGGSILHANIDRPFDSYDKAINMVEYIADKGVTYFAFNTKIQACKHNHAFYGNKCPECGGDVATEYTRIVG